MNQDLEGLFGSNADKQQHEAIAFFESLASPKKEEELPIRQSQDSVLMDMDLNNNESSSQAQLTNSQTDQFSKLLFSSQPDLFVQPISAKATKVPTLLDQSNPDIFTMDATDLEKFPFKTWINPSLFQDLGNSDTVGEFTKRALGPLEKVQRTIYQGRTFESSQSTSGHGKLLADLLEHQSFRAAANLAKSILIATNVTFVDEIQKLMIIRWYCMARLKQFELVEKEMAKLGIDLATENDAFGQLAQLEWLFQTWTGLFFNRIGHMISFEMRVFVANWFVFSGKPWRSVACLNYLLSKTETRNRIIGLKMHLANAYIACNEPLLAIRCLEQESKNELIILDALVKLEFTIGNIQSAVKRINEMEQIISGFSLDQEIPEAVFKGSKGPMVAMNRILVSIANDDFKSASEMTELLLKTHPNLRKTLLNNSSVLSYYCGTVRPAIDTFEQFLNGFPACCCNQPVCVFNMSTIYDLSFASVDRKKNLFRNYLVKYSNESFPIETIKL